MLQLHLSYADRLTHGSKMAAIASSRHLESNGLNAARHSANNNVLLCHPQLAAALAVRLGKDCQPYGTGFYPP